MPSELVFDWTDARACRALSKAADHRQQIADAHECLDALGVPRLDAQREVLTVMGRILALEAMRS